MISISLLIFLTLLCYITWKLFIEVLYEYLRAGYYLGFQNISLIYRPLSTYNSFYNKKIKYSHSYGALYEKTRLNPNIKMIFVKIFGVTQINVVDPEFIRKITFDFVSNLQKRQFLIFRSEIQKGLLYSEGENWKKSRKMLSNLFHFVLLEERSSIIEQVISHSIGDLNNKNPHLFKFTRTIAGEIVLKSLFSSDFYKMELNGKTPEEEINEIMKQLIFCSRGLMNIIRMTLGIKATKDSYLLTKKQRQVLEKLVVFKSKCREFLQKKQKQYLENKDTEIPMFLKSYFDNELKIEDPIEQAIHQIFIFLLAGEDTTGGLVSSCLFYLALFPEYQSTILQDIKHTNIHHSKPLNNFINEVNRKCVPLRDISSRKVTTPFTIDNYEFKKGTFITISYAPEMNNVKFWNNPEVFNPSRFDEPLVNPNAFTPFSSGPRNCIGQHMALMEIRIMIVRILEKYRLEVMGEVSQEVVNVGIVSIPKYCSSVKFIDR